MARFTLLGRENISIEDIFCRTFAHFQADAHSTDLMRLTIGIPSYQRRGALQRLLESLAEELAGDPDLLSAADVVVVVDGSDDGSLEMVRALDFPVRLQAVWQPNSGRAAARNAALNAAQGEFILFIDDDLVPSPGLIRRHLDSHRDSPPHILVGPCLIPDEWQALDSDRRFYSNRYSRPTEAGSIRQFDDFSPANTSGPVELFRTVGGFDESFVGWGGEDYELGVRLLNAGVEILFETEAIAWHLRDLSPKQRCSNLYEAGHNVVRMARIHPETADTMVPRIYPHRFFRLVSRVGFRSPSSLLMLSKAVLALGTAGRAVIGRRSNRLFTLAALIAYSAGVAEADERGDLVSRLLGPRRYHRLAS
jgi:GT2 family glycosyltransferase